MRYQPLHRKQIFRGRSYSRAWQIVMLAAVMLPLLASPVLAVTSQADLSVGMKTLPLLTHKIEGTATVAVVFDPANPTSKEEASQIKAILDGGFEAPGDLRLNSLLVPSDELGLMTGSRIAVLTGGLSSYYDAISAAAAANGVLTMSTDLGCVQANKCVLGIVSKPQVEIYYSKVAADAAKITFVPAFTMLVNQI